MMPSYKLLHIEDNPGDAFLLKQSLQSSHLVFELTHYDNLPHGLSYLEKETPDVVLLDLGLPGCEGLNALKAVLGQYSELSIIVLTGNENIQVGREAIAMGAMDYINKADLHPTTLSKSIVYAYERGKMLKSIKGKEEQLRQIYDTVSSIIFKVSVEGEGCYRFVSVNQAFAASVGLPESQIVGKKLEEIIPESNQELVLSQYKRAIEMRSRLKWEETAILNNQVRTGIVTVTPYFNTKGECEYLIGSIEDITDYRTASANLRKSESFLRVLFENSLTAVVVADDDGNCTEANAGAERLFGFPKAELLSMNIGQIRTLNKVPFDIESLLTSTMNEGFNEVHFFDRNENEKVALYQGIKIRKDFNVFSILDITQRSNYQKEIKRLSLIATETINGAIITDRSGKTLWINKGFEKMSGYTLEEMLGRKPGPILQGALTDANAKTEMATAIANGISFDTEVYNYSKSGKPYIVRIQCQPIYNDENAVEGFFAIETDVTAQRTSEKILKENEERLNLALKAGHLATVDWDLESNKTYVNDIYHTIFETEKELSLDNICFNSDKIHPADKKRFYKLEQKILNGEVEKIHEEYQIISGSGELKFLEMSGRVLFSDTNKPIRFVGIIKDVTQKWRANEALMQAVLEAQDREKDRISQELHDGLQQTLTTSVMNLHAMRNAVDNLPEKYRQMYFTAIQYINQGINESRTLAHSLVPVELSSYGLAACIKNIILPLSNTIQVDFCDNLKGKRLKKNVELGLLRITQEAINNIMKHAKATSAHIQLIADEHKTTLTVEDDGVGFDLQVKEKGVEYGLNSMRNRAASLGGVFEVHSSEGSGTFIFIEVPGNTFEKVTE